MKCFNKRVTFESKPEKNRRTGCVDTSGKRDPGRANS